MEIIIEYQQKTGSLLYSNPKVETPSFISIGYDYGKNTYGLIYNEKQYIITEQEVQELIQTLENIDLTKLPRFGTGLDGETYMLKVSNGWNSVSFEWWSDSCGEQWRGLMLFKEKIIGLVENYRRI